MPDQDTQRSQGRLNLCDKIQRFITAVSLDEPCKSLSFILTFPCLSNVDLHPGIQGELVTAFIRLLPKTAILYNLVVHEFRVIKIVFAFHTRICYYTIKSTILVFATWRIFALQNVSVREAVGVIKNKRIPRDRIIGNRFSIAFPHISEADNSIAATKVV